MRGDIGVTPSTGWVSAAIRRITRAPVAHAFLAVHDDDRLIFQGDTNGARFAHAGDYPGVQWLTGLSAGLSAAQRDTVVAWAVAHKGTPYSWLDDAAIGFENLFGWVPGWLSRRLNSDATLMCSQLCVAAYRAAGVDLFPDRPDGGVSPGDLWRLNHERTTGFRPARTGVR